jgi:hypothetical protein
VADHFRKFGFIGDVVAFHIRGERVGAKQRILAAKMGVLPKMPDWMFLYPEGKGGIELKGPDFKKRRAKSGKFTSHELQQIAMHDRLRLTGCWVEICESLDEVIEVLALHGLHLRATPLTEERIIAGFTKAMEGTDA